jgi:hypothetical protein
VMVLPSLSERARKARVGAGLLCAESRETEVGGSLRCGTFSRRVGAGLYCAAVAAIKQPSIMLHEEGRVLVRFWNWGKYKLTKVWSWNYSRAKDEVVGELVTWFKNFVWEKNPQRFHIKNSCWKMWRREPRENNHQRLLKQNRC